MTIKLKEVARFGDFYEPTQLNLVGIQQALVGKRLLGFMDLGDWRKNRSIAVDGDNAIALFIGHWNTPEMYVLHSENQDYSMYDVWVLEKADGMIERDDRYKAIGETIISIEDKSANFYHTWSKEIDQYWLEMRTNTKILRFGHHWNDCHYPNSIWEVI
jgi:hypothetical protein